MTPHHEDASCVRATSPAPQGAAGEGVEGRLSEDHFRYSRGVRNQRVDIFPLLFSRWEGPSDTPDCLNGAVHDSTTTDTRPPRLFVRRGGAQGVRVWNFFHDQHRGFFNTGTGVGSWYVSCNTSLPQKHLHCFHIQVRCGMTTCLYPPDQGKSSNDTLPSILFLSKGNLSY